MSDIVTQIDYALWNGGLPEPMNADKTLIPHGVEGVLEDARIEIICLRAALVTARKVERERCAKVADAQREEYESCSVTEWYANNDKASLQFERKADAVVKLAAAIRAMEDDNG